MFLCDRRCGDAAHISFRGPVLGSSVWPALPLPPPVHRLPTLLPFTLTSSPPSESSKFIHPVFASSTTLPGWLDMEARGAGQLTGEILEKVSKESTSVSLSGLQKCQLHRALQGRLPAPPFSSLSPKSSCFPQFKSVLCLQHKSLPLGSQRAMRCYTVLTATG